MRHGLQRDVVYTQRGTKVGHPTHQPAMGSTYQCYDAILSDGMGINCYVCV